jgi:hypothetical protein
MAKPSQRFDIFFDGIYQATAYTLGWDILHHWDSEWLDVMISIMV